MVSEVQGSTSLTVIFILSILNGTLIIMNGMPIDSRKHHPKPQGRFILILSHPVSPENIGLVARHMKNTGFESLRLVLDQPLDSKSYVTAVHAKDILNNARVYSNVESAVSDLEVVFAAAARKRKNFASLPFDPAVDKMLSYPPDTKIGLLFGNERTGLSSRELCSSNFKFSIPQASPQPSYNLASAVLLTLFRIFRKVREYEYEDVSELPIPRKQQEDCIRLILGKLEKKKFIHPENRDHVTEMIHDIFGRLSMTERDKNLLLALFSKGPDDFMRDTEIGSKDSTQSDKYL